MQNRGDRFPIALFALYMLFYSGQGIYNTYLNLYLNSVGLTDAQVGMTVSVSTVFILAAQLFWGVVSDRTRTKNSVLMLLYLCVAAVSLMFYLNSSYWFLLLAVTLFSVFFNPITPLQDNYTLELLETRKWDYGQVRMGGTIGYSITVLVIGIVLKNEYRFIFWMVALCMMACLLLCRMLPKVKGYRSEQTKTPYRKLLENKMLVGLILFNLAFSVGLNFFYNFYPIYFTSIGGDSSMVGTMMFACAVSEIPVLFFIRRIVDKLGVRGTLILSGLMTTLRWMLLFFLHDPTLVILANLLHGIGYTGFSYCIITYIGKTVPRDMRATGQTMNALIGSVVSRVLFGYLGGLASDWMGADRIMLLSAAVMGVSVLVFAWWSASKKDFSEA